MLYLNFFTYTAFSVDTFDDFFSTFSVTGYNNLTVAKQYFVSVCV